MAQIDTYERLQELLVDTLDVTAEIVPSAELRRDLGFETMEDLAELANALEVELGVEFPEDSDFLDCVTFHDLVVFADDYL